MMVGRGRHLVAGLVLGILLARLGAGCEGDPPRTSLLQSTATPEPSPTRPSGPETTSCPIGLQGCIFAASLSRWLREGDIDAAVQQVEAEEYMCSTPADDRRSGQGLVCKGAQPGDRVQGYTIVEGWTSGVVIGAPLPEWQYREYLRKVRAAADASLADQFGTGALRLSGFWCSVGAAADDCHDGYAVLFTFIDCCLRPEVHARAVLGFLVQRPDTDPAPRIARTFLQTLENDTDDAGVLFDGLIPWTLPD